MWPPANTITISAPPIARGARAPALWIAMPTVKTKKNVPMNSTPSLRSMRIVTPYLVVSGAVAASDLLRAPPVWDVVMTTFDAGECADAGPWNGDVPGEGMGDWRASERQGLSGPRA